jgi:putative membrane protein
MSAEKSLNHSINNAIKHYSSMFFLPSFKKSLILVLLFCVGLVGFSTFVQFPSIEGLLYSLSLGVILFFSTIFLDYIMSNIFLRNDQIYVLRRSLALSLFCWIIWSGFLLFGLIFGILFGGSMWLRLVYLGFGAVLTFRVVVFLSTSSAGILNRLLSSFLHPFLHVLIFLVFWERLTDSVSFQFLPFLIVSSIAAFFSATLFIFLLDRMGQKNYYVHAIPLFRAFMLNWVVGLNAPFEKFLEKLGKNELIEVMLLKFDSLKTKAAIIVPFVHPGPFKNIGSSLLPSQLKNDFEKEFNCDACVPLGILGHELDLASQAQNKKIIKYVIDASDFVASADKASPFVKITSDSVTASCQIFGKAAFLSFTLAPETTEDLPQELGNFVREEAKKLGIDCCIVVNAHNSITDKTELDVSLKTLKLVALKSLRKALSLPHYPFEIGVKTVFPKEFTLRDGLGPGGITSIIVNVAEQKTAYVVIDGNNMISGLREEIILLLKSKGFHEAEIFTSDTHAVSAVVLGHRGYHPVGEAMDKKTLFNHIIAATENAVLNLEPCRSGCIQILVPEVRVIGEERLHSLSTLIDSALKRAKKTVIPIFGVEGLFLILLLAFL